ncbi:MAG: PepSY domain-containing protein [Sphingobium sp.]
MRGRYAITIMMSKHIATLALAATLVAEGSIPSAFAQPPGPPPPSRSRTDQDAVRRAMLEGNVMPFSVLKRRVEEQMGGEADYLGSEFLAESNRYRFKYMRDRNVVWVDVDGRTGEILGRSGR